MATATAYHSINMDTAETWYGDVTIATASQIQIKYGDYIQNYYGNFTYNDYGLASGTVTKTNYYEFGSKIYEISGGNYNALTVEGYINAGNISGLFSYIFSGMDTLNGSNESDKINGFAGDDKIYGNGGNDLAKGSLGNDLLNGGVGADTMLGGAGNDTYYIENIGDKVYETTTSTGTTNAGGTDKVISTINVDLSSSTGASFIENITLSGTTALNAIGNSLANTLIGNSAANVLNGKTGADILLGGAGNDTYYVDNTSDKVYETTSITSITDAGGTDTVISSVTTSLNVTGSTFVENLRLNSSNTINGTGNALNNTIYASAGNNIIDGLGGLDTVSYGYATAGVSIDLRNTTATQATVSSGSDFIKNMENIAGSNFNDSLRGNLGANILAGSGGSDTLYGYENNDLLLGGAGNDILYGGAGNDLFRFDAALSTATVTNLDQIKDFSAADDSIQLENSIFRSLGITMTGTINSAYFKANTTGLASDSNDYIIYETDTGKLFYDTNGSGAGASIQIALIGTNTALTANDFILV